MLNIFLNPPDFMLVTTAILARERGLIRNEHVLLAGKDRRAWDCSALSSPDDACPDGAGDSPGLSLDDVTPGTRARPSRFPRRILPPGFVAITVPGEWLKMCLSWASHGFEGKRHQPYNAPAMPCTRMAISTSRRRGYRWLAGIFEEDVRAECGNGVIPAGPGASLLSG